MVAMGSVRDLELGTSGMMRAAKPYCCKSWRRLSWFVQKFSYKIHICWNRTPRNNKKQQAQEPTSDPKYSKQTTRSIPLHQWKKAGSLKTRKEVSRCTRYTLIHILGRRTTSSKQQISAQQQLLNCKRTMGGSWVVVDHNFHAKYKNKHCKLIANQIY